MPCPSSVLRPWLFAVAPFMSPCEDVRFVLVMAGFLAILLIADTFNKSTQPRGTSAKVVDDNVELVKANLDHLLLRQSARDGKQASTLAAASLLWYGGKHPCEVPQTATHCEKSCAKLHDVKLVKTTQPSGESCTERRALLKMQYRATAPAPKEAITFKLLLTRR